MAAHFFRVTLKSEGGPYKGLTYSANARVLARDEVSARRLLIGFVLANSKPVVPPEASPEEKEHITTHWNQNRVVRMDNIPSEDLQELFNVPPMQILYWWAWEGLPASEEE